jgi:DNA mismatch repair protein MSH6
MISAKNIHLYDILQASSTLVLDGQTLMNLEVFQNTTDGTDKGTLIKLLNHAMTPFGKRLFQKWLCHPLRDIRAINDRLDSVDDLHSISGFLEEVRLKLRKLPDLERVIARIHTGSCLVKDFVNCLEALESVRSIFSDFSSYRHGFKSKILSNLSSFEYSEEALDTLKYFREAFDHADALSSGKLELYQGYDAVLDEHRETVTKLEEKLDQYRKQCEKEISCKISFKDIGKEIYQMEVPVRAHVPRDWVVMSKTQQLNRYYSNTLRNLVNELAQAKEHCEIAMRDIKMRVYQRFDCHYGEWLQLVNTLAYLDCLCSLAQFRRNLNEPCCKPEFVDSTVSTLELEEMRHPCIQETLQTDYIPNDLYLRNDQQSMVCLTGANMAGKSTLLRQTCIAVIMAQLGCYIPAAKCRLTPFDRIFTRIGANDNIMAGQSTFMVELSETSKILKEATPKSLVILDELGRGTSTFDGYAIAYAVLHHLVTHVGCLGLFSTHYGNLTKEFEKNKLVALKYMDFHVDGER